MKKKQFALIFMTLVIMLMVWYIKSPLSANANKEEPIAPVSAEDQEFTALREAVNAERAIETASWDKIIADNEATLANKEAAVSMKNALSDLTEKEVLLEVEVINLGYADAFVHSTADGVEVYVLAAEESGSRAVEIINRVYEKFDTTENVVVKFKVTTAS